MQIDWNIVTTGNDYNEHGLAYNYVMIDVEIFPDNGGSHKYTIVVEDWGSDTVYQNVVRSTADIKLTACVLEDLDMRLEHYGFERYDELPDGVFTIQQL